MKYFFSIPLILTPLLNVQAVAQDAAAPFTITITPINSNLRLGDPIMIHIVLQSTSEKQIPMPEVRHDGTQGEYNYRVTVADSKGGAPPDTDHGKRLKGGGEVMGLRSTIIKSLQKGDTVAEDLDLNTVVKINSPGDYTVQVERADPLYSSLHVKSNKLTIHVNP